MKNKSSFWEFSGMAAQNKDFNIRCFPNPATDHITIHTSHNAKCSLMNALGKQVKEQTLTKGENTVNLNQLPAGIYYIRVWEHPGDIKTHKLLVR
ncbi:MAG: T9SS type A sorting domain-containing protein [Bacteroidota bacterium]|nr:T9SS type A sorting domain-containing protein [Bacteroidota bacterium]